MKKCFLISPIGSEGSETREHADDVYDYIIKPAMEDCGIQCLRADHLQEPGKITDQMFREIFASDVCVALLTGHNPNVFYELALAQAAGRPVIILLHKSETLPFDIRDLRCVTYDLKPRNLFDRIFSTQLKAHFLRLEELNWQIESPFSAYGGPEIFGGNNSAPRFFERHGAYGGTDKWLQLIHDTVERCDLMSLSLEAWKNRNGFRELVLRKAESGCQFRLLQMHWENPVLHHFAAEPKSYEYMAPLVKLSSQYFERFAAGVPNIHVRQIFRGCPHYRIVVTDQTAFLSPYTYCNTNAALWQTSPDSALYRSIGKEFNALWDLNDPAHAQPAATS